MYADIQDFILLREEEGIIDYRCEDIYRYAGPRALIASALVFRLMKEAISDLCPDEIPMRKEFRIVSGHSGLGVRDGFEYLTRASSDDRYIVDASDAPRGGHHPLPPEVIYFLGSRIKETRTSTVFLPKSWGRNGFHK